MHPTQFFLPVINRANELLGAFVIAPTPFTGKEKVANLANGFTVKVEKLIYNEGRSSIMVVREFDGYQSRFQFLPTKFFDFYSEWTAGPVRDLRRTDSRDPFVRFLEGHQTNRYTFPTTTGDGSDEVLPADSFVPPKAGQGGFTWEFDYVHTQTTPAQEWTVRHNLGRYRPVVSVYNVGSVLVEPQSINYVDANSLVVVLAQPMAGLARVF